MSVEERKALIEKLNKRFEKMENSQLTTVNNVITGMELERSLHEDEQ